MQLRIGLPKMGMRTGTLLALAVSTTFACNEGSLKQEKTRGGEYGRTEAALTTGWHLFQTSTGTTAAFLEGIPEDRQMFWEIDQGYDREQSRVLPKYTRRSDLSRSKTYWAYISAEDEKLNVNDLAPPSFHEDMKADGYFTKPAEDRPQGGLGAFSAFRWDGERQHLVRLGPGEVLKAGEAYWIETSRVCDARSWFFSDAVRLIHGCALDQSAFRIIKKSDWSDTKETPDRELPTLLSNTLVLQHTATAKERSIQDILAPPPEEAGTDDTAVYVPTDPEPHFVIAQDEQGAWQIYEGANLGGDHIHIALAGTYEAVDAEVLETQFGYAPGTPENERQPEPGAVIRLVQLVSHLKTQVKSLKGVVPLGQGENALEPGASLSPGRSALHLVWALDERFFNQGASGQVSPDFIEDLLVSSSDVHFESREGDLAELHNTEVVLDKTAPLLYVRAEDEVLYSHTPHFTVAGVVYDEDLIEFSVNGIVVAEGSQSFSQEVWLTPGTNQVRLVAIDGSANATSIVKTIIYDSAAPIIELQQPDMTKVLEGAAYLEGRLVESYLKAFTINDQPVEVIGEGFRLRLPVLSLGLHTFELWAIDEMGLEDERRVAIYIDEHGAKWVTDLPETGGADGGGAQTEEPIGFFVDVTATADNTDLDIVIVDDHDVEERVRLSEVLEGGASTRHQRAYVFFEDLSLVNTSTLTAIDIANVTPKSSLVSFRVTYFGRSDAPTSLDDHAFPRLAILAPEEEVAYTNVPIYRLQGIVADEQLMLVRINDVVTTTISGAFSSFIKLDHQTNEVQVIAMDLAQQESSVKRTIVYDNQPPVIALTTPEKERVYVADYQIVGTVNDPHLEGLILSKVGTDEYETVELKNEGGAFKVDISLDVGHLNVFELIARDRAQNERRRRIEVFYETTYRADVAPMRPTGVRGWPQDGSAHLRWSPPRALADGTSIPRGITPRYRVYRNLELIRDEVLDLSYVGSVPAALEPFEFYVTAILDGRNGILESERSSIAAITVGQEELGPSIGELEAPSIVSDGSLATSMPEVAFSEVNGREYTHLVYIARGDGEEQTDQVRYLRSDRMARHDSWTKQSVSLGAAEESWLITEVAVSAYQSKVVVAWLEIEKEGEVSRVRTAQSDNRGDSFNNERTLRQSTRWKRDVDAAFDRTGHHHLIWGEANKVYYLKNLMGPDGMESNHPGLPNVFDLKKRWVNHEEVKYQHFVTTECEGESDCPCTANYKDTYSFGLETAEDNVCAFKDKDCQLKRGFGEYLTRIEETFTESPSLQVSHEAITIVARQTRMFDNYSYPNRSWMGLPKSNPYRGLGPMVPRPTPTRDCGWIAGANLKFRQGHRQAWKLNQYACELEVPENRAELLRLDYDWDKQRSWGHKRENWYSYDHKRGHLHQWYQYDFAGQWHEGDHIKVAQRPVIPGRWSYKKTQTRGVPRLYSGKKYGYVAVEGVTQKVEQGWSQGDWHREPFSKPRAPTDTKEQFEETLQNWRISHVEDFYAEREADYAECGGAPNPAFGPTGPTYAKTYTTKDGRSYAVFEKGVITDPNNPEGNPIYLATSENGTEWVLRRDPVAHGYMPSVGVATSGEIAVLYYTPDTGRPSESGVPLGKIMLARSQNNGVTFVEEALNEGLDPDTKKHRVYPAKPINWRAYGSDSDYYYGVPSLATHGNLFVATWVKQPEVAGDRDRIMTARVLVSDDGEKLEKEIVVTTPETVTADENFSAKLECVNQYHMLTEGCDAQKTSLQYGSKAFSTLGDFVSDAGSLNGSKEISIEAPSGYGTAGRTQVEFKTVKDTAPPKLHYRYNNGFSRSWKDADIRYPIPPLEGLIGYESGFKSNYDTSEDFARDWDQWWAMTMELIEADRAAGYFDATADINEAHLREVVEYSAPPHSSRSLSGDSDLTSAVKALSDVVSANEKLLKLGDPGQSVTSGPVHTYKPTYHYQFKFRHSGFERSSEDEDDRYPTPPMVYGQNDRYGYVPGFETWEEYVRNWNEWKTAFDRMIEEDQAANRLAPGAESHLSEIRRLEQDFPGKPSDIESIEVAIVWDAELETVVAALNNLYQSPAPIAPSEAAAPLVPLVDAPLTRTDCPTPDYQYTRHPTYNYKPGFNLSTYSGGRYPYPPIGTTVFAGIEPAFSSHEDFLRAVRSWGTYLDHFVQEDQEAGRLVGPLVDSELASIDELRANPPEKPTEMDHIKDMELWEQKARARINNLNRLFNQCPDHEEENPIEGEEPLLGEGPNGFHLSHEKAVFSAAGLKITALWGFSWEISREDTSGGSCATWQVENVGEESGHWVVRSSASWSSFSASGASSEVEFELEAGQTTEVDHCLRPAQVSSLAERKKSLHEDRITISRELSDTPEGEQTVQLLLVGFALSLPDDPPRISAENPCTEYPVTNAASEPVQLEVSVLFNPSVLVTIHGQAFDEAAPSSKTIQAGATKMVRICSDDVLGLDRKGATIRFQIPGQYLQTQSVRLHVVENVKINDDADTIEDGLSGESPDVISNNAAGAYRRAKMLLNELYNPALSLQREYGIDERNEDTPYLASFERMWAYTQGILVAQFSRQGDPRAQATARMLCDEAIQNTHEGEGDPEALAADPNPFKEHIKGWHFSRNTRGDGWKDMRLVTGANAWALHGLGVFMSSGEFKSLPPNEKKEMQECYLQSLDGLDKHRVGDLVTDPEHQWLMTAGTTTKGLQNAESPLKLDIEVVPGSKRERDLFRRNDPDCRGDIRWAYYDILDVIGYDELRPDKNPKITSYCRDENGNRRKETDRTYVLTDEDQDIFLALKERSRAINIVTEHNLDVLSVLNHAIKHWHEVTEGMSEASMNRTGGLEYLVEWRDRLNEAIFHSNSLYNDQDGRVITGGDINREHKVFEKSEFTAIDNCSWLALSVDYGTLPKEHKDKLATCLDYTIRHFARKDLPFHGKTYHGTFYFPREFKDPYIEQNDDQEELYHLEATTGLILGLLYFVDHLEDEYPIESQGFRAEANAMWADMQNFLLDHGLPYSTVRIQDLMTLLPSSTATIWYIDVFDYYASRDGGLDQPLKNYSHEVPYTSLLATDELSYPLEEARGLVGKSWQFLQGKTVAGTQPSPAADTPQVFSRLSVESDGNGSVPAWGTVQGPEGADLVVELSSKLDGRPELVYEYTPVNITSISLTLASANASFLGWHTQTFAAEGTVIPYAGQSENDYVRISVIKNKQEWVLGTAVLDAKGHFNFRHEVTAGPFDEVIADGVPVGRVFRRASSMDIPDLMVATTAIHNAKVQSEKDFTLLSPVAERQRHVSGVRGEWHFHQTSLGGYGSKRTETIALIDRSLKKQTDVVTVGGGGDAGRQVRKIRDDSLVVSGQIQSGEGSVAVTYLEDQALAIIAAVTQGDMAQAKKWVDGLLAIRVDGNYSGFVQFPYAVNASTGEMLASYYQTGAQMLALYAIAFYAEHHETEQGEILSLMKDILITLEEVYFDHATGRFMSGGGWPQSLKDALSRAAADTSIPPMDLPIFTSSRLEDHVYAANVYRLAQRLVPEGEPRWSSQVSQIFNTLYRDFWEGPDAVSSREPWSGRPLPYLGAVADAHWTETIRATTLYQLWAAQQGLLVRAKRSADLLTLWAEADGVPSSAGAQMALAYGILSKRGAAAFDPRQEELARSDFLRLVKSNPSRTSDLAFTLIAQNPKGFLGVRAGSMLGLGVPHIKPAGQTIMADKVIREATVNTLFALLASEFRPYGFDTLLNRLTLIGFVAESARNGVDPQRWGEEYQRAFDIQLLVTVASLSHLCESSLPTLLGGGFGQDEFSGTVISRYLGLSCEDASKQFQRLFFRRVGTHDLQDLLPLLEHPNDAFEILRLTEALHLGDDRATTFDASPFMGRLIPNTHASTQVAVKMPASLYAAQRASEKSPLVLPEDISAPQVALAMKERFRQVIALGDGGFAGLEEDEALRYETYGLDFISMMNPGAPAFSSRETLEWDVLVASGPSGTQSVRYLSGGVEVQTPVDAPEAFYLASAQEGLTRGQMGQNVRFLRQFINMEAAGNLPYVARISGVSEAQLHLMMRTGAFRESDLLRILRAPELNLLADEIESWASLFVVLSPESATWPAALRRDGPASTVLALHQEMFENGALTALFDDSVEALALSEAFEGVAQVHFIPFNPVPKGQPEEDDSVCFEVYRYNGNQAEASKIFLSASSARAHKIADCVTASPFVDQDFASFYADLTFESTFSPQYAVRRTDVPWVQSFQQGYAIVPPMGSMNETAYATPLVERSAINLQGWKGMTGNPHGLFQLGAVLGLGEDNQPQISVPGELSGCHKLAALPTHGMDFSEFILLSPQSVESHVVEFEEHDCYRGQAFPVRQNHTYVIYQKRLHDWPKQVLGGEVTVVSTGDADTAPSAASIEVAVAVFYTDAAQAQIRAQLEGTPDALDSWTQKMLANANTIFADSKIPVAFVAAPGTHDVSIPEMSGSGANLGRLHDEGDDRMERAYQNGKADLVVLVTSDRAQPPVEFGSLNWETLHNVSALTWDQSIKPSLAEAFGRNLGCRDDSRSANVSSFDSAIFPYASSHTFAANGRTYVTLGGHGGGGTKVALFSNPEVLYSGQPTGTATKNCARAIEETAEVLQHIDGQRPWFDRDEKSLLSGLAVTGGDPKLDATEGQKDSEEVRTYVLTNNADHPVIWRAETVGGLLGEAAILSITPSRGTLPSGGSIPIEVTVRALELEALEAGQHAQELWFLSVGNIAGRTRIGGQVTVAPGAADPSSLWTLTRGNLSLDPQDLPPFIVVRSKLDDLGAPICQRLRATQHQRFGYTHSAEIVGAQFADKKPWLTVSTQGDLSTSNLSGRQFLDIDVCLDLPAVKTLPLGVHEWFGQLKMVFKRGVTGYTVHRWIKLQIQDGPLEILGAEDGRLQVAAGTCTTVGVRNNNTEEPVGWTPMVTSKENLGQSTPAFFLAPDTQQWTHAGEEGRFDVCNQVESSVGTTTEISLVGGDDQKLTSVTIETVPEDQLGEPQDQGLHGQLGIEECGVSRSAAIRVPSGYWGYEVIPNVVETGGQDPFYIEVRFPQTTDRKSVVLELGNNILGPEGEQSGDRVTFNDLGLSPDEKTDGVYTAGPFWQLAVAAGTHRHGPQGARMVEVGNLTGIFGGRNLTFNTQPQVGIIDADQVAKVSPREADAKVTTTDNFVNVCSNAGSTQLVLRKERGEASVRTLAGADPAILPRAVYRAGIPDAFDHMFQISTYHIESMTNASENERAGATSLIRNSIHGLNAPFIDKGVYGSNAQLQAITYLDTMVAGLNSFRATHELMHRWGIYFSGLADDSGSHYKDRVGVRSVLGGRSLTLQPNGKVKVSCPPMTSAPLLDRYLLGLVTAEQAGDVPYLDTDRHLKCGEEVAGELLGLSVQDMAERYGARTPSGPFFYRIGFVGESLGRKLNRTEMAFYHTYAEHYTAPSKKGTWPALTNENWVAISDYFGEDVRFETSISAPRQVPGESVPVETKDHPLPQFGDGWVTLYVDSQSQDPAFGGPDAPYHSVHDALVASRHWPIAVRIVAGSDPLFHYVRQDADIIDQLYAGDVVPWLDGAPHFQFNTFDVEDAPASIRGFRVSGGVPEQIVCAQGSRSVLGDADQSTLFFAEPFSVAPSGHDGFDWLGHFRVNDLKTRQGVLPIKDKPLYCVAELDVTDHELFDDSLKLLGIRPLSHEHVVLTPKSGAVSGVTLHLPSEATTLYEDGFTLYSDGRGRINFEFENDLSSNCRVLFMMPAGLSIAEIADLPAVELVSHEQECVPGSFYSEQLPLPIDVPFFGAEASGGDEWTLFFLPEGGSLSNLRELHSAGQLTAVTLQTGALVDAVVSDDAPTGGEDLIYFTEGHKTRAEVTLRGVSTDLKLYQLQFRNPLGSISDKRYKVRIIDHPEHEAPGKVPYYKNWLKPGLRDGQTMEVNGERNAAEWFFGTELPNDDLGRDRYTMAFDRDEFVRELGHYPPDCGAVPNVTPCTKTVNGVKTIKVIMTFSDVDTEAVYQRELWVHFDPKDPVRIDPPKKVVKVGSEDVDFSFTIHNDGGAPIEYNAAPRVAGVFYDQYGLETGSIINVVSRSKVRFTVPAYGSYTHTMTAHGQKFEGLYYDPMLVFQLNETWGRSLIRPTYQVDFDTGLDPNPVLWDNFAVEGEREANKFGRIGLLDDGTVGADGHLKIKAQTLIVSDESLAPEPDFLAAWREVGKDLSRFNTLHFDAAALNKSSVGQTVHVRLVEQGGAAWVSGRTSLTESYQTIVVGLNETYFKPEGKALGQLSKQVRDIAFVFTSPEGVSERVEFGIKHVLPNKAEVVEVQNVLGAVVPVSPHPAVVDPEPEVEPEPEEEEVPEEVPDDVSVSPHERIQVFRKRVPWYDVLADRVSIKGENRTINGVLFEVRSKYGLLEPSGGQAYFPAGKNADIHFTPNFERLNVLPGDEVIEVIYFENEALGMKGQVPVWIELGLTGGRGPGVGDDDPGANDRLFFSDFETTPDCDEACQEWNVAVPGGQLVEGEPPSDVTAKTERMSGGNRLVFSHPRLSEWGAAYKALDIDLTRFEAISFEVQAVKYKSESAINAGCVNIRFSEDDQDHWASERFQISADKEVTIVVPLKGLKGDGSDGSPSSSSYKKRNFDQIAQIAFSFFPNVLPGQFDDVAFSIDSIRGHAQLPESVTNPNCNLVTAEAPETEGDIVIQGSLNPMSSVRDLLTTKSLTYDRLAQRVLDQALSGMSWTKGDTDNEGKKVPHWNPGFANPNLFIQIHESSANTPEYLIAEIVHQITHHRDHQKGQFTHPVACRDATKRGCAEPTPGRPASPMSERQWRDFYYSQWLRAEAEAVFNSMKVLAEIYGEKTVNIKDFLSLKGGDTRPAEAAFHDYLQGRGSEESVIRRLMILVQHRREWYGAQLGPRLNERLMDVWGYGMEERATDATKILGSPQEEWTRMQMRDEYGHYNQSEDSRDQDFTWYREFFPPDRGVLRHQYNGFKDTLDSDGQFQSCGDDEILFTPVPCSGAAPVPFHIVEFAGHKMKARRHSPNGAEFGPNANHLSDREENVRIDENGALRLSITRDPQYPDRWYGAEVILKGTFGYGRYAFTVEADLENWDKNAVLGLFTWDDSLRGGAPLHNREIDIEITRWGIAGNDPVQFAMPPYDTGFVHRFTPDPSQVQRINTYVFDWSEDRIRFSMYAGRDRGQAIETWFFNESEFIQEPGKEEVRINLWLHQLPEDTEAKEARAPASKQRVDVIIHDFRFDPVEP